MTAVHLSFKSPFLKCFSRTLKRSPKVDVSSPRSSSMTYLKCEWVHVLNTFFPKFLTFSNEIWYFFVAILPYFTLDVFKRLLDTFWTVLGTVFDFFVAFRNNFSRILDFHGLIFVASGMLFCSILKPRYIFHFFGAHFWRENRYFFLLTE